MRGALLRSLALAALLVAAAGSARAGDASPPLVRGGAPFALGASGFGMAGSAMGILPQGKLDVTPSPSEGSFTNFLLNPHPQFGQAVDLGSGTTKRYAGLSWNVFDGANMFGRVGLGGSFTQPGAEDPNNRFPGLPLTLHGSLEFGYQLGQQHSLSLSLDRASPNYTGGDRGESGESLRLRYGLHF
jgi:hypothetical protein